MDETQQRRVFDDWLKGYSRILFKVVNAYASSAHDQEDLFQEVATQVWNSIPRYRGECKVTTWLYRVALNSSRAWTRKERKHRGTETFEESEPALHVPPPKPDPRLAWLHEEIAQMDHVDRSLTLLLLDGFSYRDMAETLGITESNVGVKINRIKTRLTAKSKENLSNES